MSNLTADLGQHKYMLAMPCYDSKLCTLTVNSLLSSIMSMSNLGIKYQVCMLNSGTLIDASRNEIADAFMKSDCDTLICLDSDMTWKWEDMLHLLAYSHYHPVVAGAYQNKSDNPKFYLSMKDPNLTSDGLIQINHVGFGFVAIKKDVFLQLNDITPSYTHHQTGQKFKAYFQLKVEDGVYLGEDIYFFKKLQELNIPAYIDPKIKLGHVGMKEYNVPFYTALQ